MIERDETQRSVVVSCSGCGARELVNTPAQADVWAVAHLRRHIEIDRYERERAIAAAHARLRRRDTPS